MTMDGRTVNSNEVRRTLGCKGGTVLVAVDKSSNYTGFMRVVNELQASKCLKVGLLVEDAPKGKQ